MGTHCQKLLDEIGNRRRSKWVYVDVQRVSQRRILTSSDSDHNTRQPTEGIKARRKEEHGYTFALHPGPPGPLADSIIGLYNHSACYLFHISFCSSSCSGFLTFPMSPQKNLHLVSQSLYLGAVVARSRLASSAHPTRPLLLKKHLVDIYNDPVQPLKPTPHYLTRERKVQK
jgi:hypothetical protein